MKEASLVRVKLEAAVLVVAVQVVVLVEVEAVALVVKEVEAAVLVLAAHRMGTTLACLKVMAWVSPPVILSLAQLLQTNGESYVSSGLGHE